MSTYTYTLAQHERDHWQGNRPDDCHRCWPTPPTAPSDDEFRGTALTGLPIAILASVALVTGALGLYAAATTGALLNGWFAWAIPAAFLAAAAGALSERNTR